MSVSGLAILNNGSEFSSKYPALLVDRTNSYGYKNYIVTFVNEPAYPPTPTSSNPTTSIYINLITLFHNLGYIPAFESVTIGYGLPQGTAGISMFNEDGILSRTGNVQFTSYNSIIFRADYNNLYVSLFRTANYDINSGVILPTAMKGVQLNINIQIFAMGLNDDSSVVL